MANRPRRFVVVNALRGPKATSPTPATEIFFVAPRGDSQAAAAAFRDSPARAPTQRVHRSARRMFRATL
jgi:hypothetical protein